MSILNESEEKELIRIIEEINKEVEEIDAKD